jgi:hypothetical protein
MRRGLIALLAALPLSLGTAATASAHHHPGRGWGWGGGGHNQVTVDGTVVSVDTSHNSFVANAYEVGGGDEYGDGSSGYSGSSWGSGNSGSGGYGDDGGWSSHSTAHHRGGGSDAGSSSHSTTQVTITTNGDTDIEVNGSDATISDLVAGQTFQATFEGQPGTDITTLVTNNPAASLYAHTPPQPYAFVGTVTAVDTTAETVTVNVTNSLPSGLVPAGSSPATFEVNTNTLILGGTSTSLFGGLSNVTVGDVVAGGLVASAGETLSQVEATPLRLLIDFPVSGGGTGHVKKVKATALGKAASLLGIKVKKTKTKGKGRGKAATKSKAKTHR